MSNFPIDIDRNGFFACSPIRSKRSSMKPMRLSTVALSAMPMPIPVTPEHRESSQDTFPSRTPGSDSNVTAGKLDGNSDHSDDNTSDAATPLDTTSAMGRSISSHNRREQPMQHEQTINEAAETAAQKTSIQTSDTLTTPPSSRWVGVRAMLENEPCLATQKGLFLALKHHAPIQVVQFLLTINPNVMDIAKTGPTPLQVALYHEASLDVIALLLEASPFGLCVTNSDCPEDPLSYAKRRYGEDYNKYGLDSDVEDKDCQQHMHRPGLIELLSRPLSYWIKERKGKRDRQAKKNQYIQRIYHYRRQQQQNKGSWKHDLQQLNDTIPSHISPPALQLKHNRNVIPSRISPPPLRFSHRLRTSVADCITESVNNNICDGSSPFSSAALKQPSPPPPPLPKKGTDTFFSNKDRDNKNHATQQQKTHTPKASIIATSVDREEFNNIKKICARLVKAHKNISNQIIATRGNIDAQSELLATMRTKEEILEELLQQQRSQFIRNLIALDMKEKNFQSRLDQMEKRYIMQLETRLDRCMSSTRVWNESTRERLLDLQSDVEAEAKINDSFRNGMSDWVERWHYENQENKNNRNVPSSTCISSYVFATNLGETDETAPLCDEFRRGGRIFCRSDGNGTMDSGAAMVMESNVNDDLDISTDPIIGTNDNRHRQCTLLSWKRPWIPFKNRDRIQMVDSESQRGI